MKKARLLGFRQPSPFWRYWVPPILWALVILVLSGEVGAATNTTGILRWILSWLITLSPQELDLLHGWLRQAAHLLTYGILSVLWFRALAFYFPRRPWANIALALMLCLVVALLDEGHQAMVASRTGNLGDVALDMTGAAFLIVAALWWKKTSMIPTKLRPPSP